MRSKIFRSAFLVSVLMCVSCIALFMGVLHEYFGSVQENQLHSELILARAGVEENGVSYLEKLELRDERLTLVAPDGSVVFDSWIDASELENHGDRKEIREAYGTGTGSSSRYSSTFTEEFVYLAVRLSSGDVLRIASGRQTMLSLLVRMIQPVGLILIVALILSWVFASRLEKRLTDSGTV